MSCISDFVNRFQHGARANLFRVEIPGRLSEDAKFYIKGAQIPAKSIARVDMRYMNNIIPVAGETATFEDWTVTVINDVNYGIRSELEQWMDAIKTNDRTLGANNQTEYFSIANVTQVLPDGNDSAITYELHNIWPSNLAQIDLSYDSQDTVQEYSVTFTYSHWQRV